MKICIFTHTFPRFTGDTAAPFMGELVDALALTGHQIVVLMPFDSGIKRQKRRYKLVTYKYIFPESLHVLGYSRTLGGDRSMSLVGYFLSPFLYVFGFFALLRLVRKEKINLVSSHWIIPNGFIAALVSKLTNVPFTTTIPGSDVYMGGKNFLFRWMVGYAAGAANYVLSDSSHYFDQLHDLGYYPTKTKVIRYGVNMHKFKLEKKDMTILKALGVDISRRIILACGRLVAKKGFIYLVRAMPYVLAKNKYAKLVIVGDGEERQNLEKEVVKLRLESKVIFAGTVPYDILAKYYNIADVFVMPSIKDAKGNLDASPVAMMEAMACGVPVVATKFAGSGDLFANTETGVLVREKDVKLIGEGIIKLLVTTNLKKSKNTVRHVALSNFSTSIISDKYIETFNEVLRSNG